MGELFVSVCRMSLTASYCAAAVLGIRMLLHRFPKKYIYFLWIVVLVRFAVPFSLPGLYGAGGISGRVIPEDMGLREIRQDGAGAEQNGGVYRTLSMPFWQSAADDGGLQAAVHAAAWIWLAVASALLCYGGISYFLLKQRLGKARCVEDGVYETDRIRTAFVMGVLKPRIYLPGALAGWERAYVLSHERMHVKRRDYLVRQLASALVCVHWFNPVAWLSLLYLCRDMELSCDEEVIRLSGTDERERFSYKKGYAASLLAAAGGREAGFSGTLLFGGGDVKRRIRNVLAFRQPGKITKCILAATVVLAAAAMMGSGRTGAMREDEADSALKEKGYAYVCRIPEAYWSGIEGLSAGEEAWPVIVAADQVYDDGNGNMAAMTADVYCLTKEGLRSVGEISGSGTAYPLCYDRTGIYVNSGHAGNRCRINTDTWETEIVERVEVVYSGGVNGVAETYYVTEDGVTGEADEERFLMFFEKCGDTLVMDFSEL